MAYISGLVSKEELDILQKNGIEPEDDPDECAQQEGADPYLWAKFYVDCDVYDFLTRPLGPERSLIKENKT